MRKFIPVLLSMALALSLFAAPAAYAAEAVAADSGVSAAETTPPADSGVGSGGLSAGDPSLADSPAATSPDSDIPADGSAVEPGTIPDPEAEALGDTDDGGQAVYSTLADAQAAGIVADVPADPASYDASQIIVVLKGIDAQAAELSSVEAAIADISTEPEAAEAEMNAAGDLASDLAVVSLPADVSVEDALLAAANDQHVAFAQPDFIYQLLTTGQDAGGNGLAASAAVDANTANGAAVGPAPEADDSYSPLATINDPSRGSQWWLNSVQAYNAWDRQKAQDGNPRVTIAVIDTGVRLNHQDLDGNLWAGHAYNAVNGTTLTTSFGAGGDIGGHGTSVAGIIAAETNNGLLGAGISYNAKILPINVFQGSGSNITASSSSIIRAYDYILQKRSALNIRVVNLSLGAYSNDPQMHNRVIAARNAGILTVAAAGNEGSSSAHTDSNGDSLPSYPSDYAEAVAVVSVDQSNGHSSFSDHNVNKDIAAPGEAIYSTSSSSVTGFGPITGTSAASPIVAGAAALLFSARPYLNPDQVASLLFDSSLDLGPSGKDKQFGSGLLQANSALQLLASRYPSTVATPITAGSYIIRPANSSTRVFDIYGASGSQGAQAVLWSSTMNTNQRFNFSFDNNGNYSITAAHSGQALDVEGGRARVGARVIQWPNGRTANQLWQVESHADGSFSFLSKLSTSLALDVNGAADFDGNGVSIYSYHGGANQRFFLIPANATHASTGQVLANGYYTMRSVMDLGYMVDIPNASYDNNVTPILWPATGNNNQQFRIEYVNGYYRIRSMHSGLAMDNPRGNRVPGSLIQWSYGGGDNQLFAIVRQPDNSYSFISKCGTENSSADLTISISRTTSLQSAPLALARYTGGTNQRFLLEAVQSEPFSNGIFGLAPYNDRAKRIDINGGSTNANASALIWGYTGGANQKFYATKLGGGSVGEAVYTFAALHSGLLLTASGSSVIQTRVSGAPSAAQQWRVTRSPGGVVLRNMATNGFMSYSAPTGLTLVGSTSPTNASTVFIVNQANAIDAGHYAFYTPAGTAVDLTGSKPDNGTPIGIWWETNGINQKWRVDNVGQALSIKSALSGKSLDVYGGSSADNAPLVQWSYSGASNQLFYLSPSGDGYFYVSPANASGKYLGAGNNPQSGSKLFLTSNPSYALKLRYQPVTVTDLEVKLNNILNSLGRDGDMARKCFFYVVTNYSYRSGSLYPPGDWAPTLALEMINYGSGNCYRYAALYCMLIVYSGYDAWVVSGHVPRAGGGQAPHGWVEVRTGGQIYICDPDLQVEWPSHNWYMRSYSSAPTTYYR